MKLGSKISILLLAICQNGWAQGFMNMDFEDATIDFTGSYQNFVTKAFPGWTVTAPYIFYDDFSLSGGSISVYDTNPPPSLQPIQGKYFARLIGSDNPSYGAISLGQTAQVPAGTQSISFWGTDDGMQITFAGQALNFVETGGTANYNIYAADISAYADQTGQLLFTVPLNSGGGFLDNIQFSSVPIPEPSEFALSALGALFLGYRRWRNSSRCNLR